MTNRHIDDIALFFSKNGKPARCFIPYAVYTDPKEKLDVVRPYWPKAALLEEGLESPSGRFFVTNLALLEDPGTLPVDVPLPDPLPSPAAPPGPDDLVVIPHDDPKSAYVVRKATYEDETKCIPIKDDVDPDLVFMALNDGVVLANVPKYDLAGATCFLLNLLALRSYP